MLLIRRNKNSSHFLLFFIDLQSHYIPSTMPLPSNPQQLCICQSLFLILCSPNCYVSEGIFVIPKSALFAYISTGTLAKS